MNRFAFRPGLFLLGFVLLGTGAAGGQAITFTVLSETAGLAPVTGYGVAVTDYDGDGWEDLLVTTAGGSVKLFRNEGNLTFSDRTVDAGLGPGGRYFVPLWGDVNNDGHPDLFLGRKSEGINRLFRNNGDGTFTDVTETAGIAPEADVAAATFGDFDGDGYIDLFLAVDRAPDLLYRNRSDLGDIRFEDVTGRAGVAGPPSVAMQATWIDYNHDTRPDLFAVHDGNVESRLYVNEGFLPLRNVARETGIADVGAGNSMGIAWGDFDGDGWEDAYVTRIGRGGLYRNNHGTFEEVAVARGADRNGMSWGVVFADLDNDGDLDLFIVNTSGYDESKSFLYVNENGHFTDRAAAAGAALHLDAYGLATGDFDRDGRLDLVIGAGEGLRLLHNTTVPAGHHLTVRLEGRTTNRMALGTRIEVVAGGRTHVRTVSGGDSFCSQSSPTLHIGLGPATRVDTLRIFWRSDLVQTETNLNVDAHYTFIEPGEPTGIEPEPLPGPFRLDPNYPNPFDTSTVLSFTLPYPLHVTLTVFDLLGRPVATLVDAPRPPGPHRVLFEPGELPGGIYFYRLQAGSFTATRPLVRRN
ncbi:MAG: hypothetical protein KatS3mg043_1268 [Rhodothermaceae bacterium]|nr:MAG: hypothetical protein KatS3mg043_1268 [Rhodothermaceae bacterium]